MSWRCKKSIKRSQSRRVRSPVKQRPMIYWKKWKNCLNWWCRSKLKSWSWLKIISDWKTCSGIITSVLNSDHLSWLLLIIHLVTSWPSDRNSLRSSFPTTAERQPPSIPTMDTSKTTKEESFVRSAETSSSSRSPEQPSSVLSLTSYLPRYSGYPQTLAPRPQHQRMRSSSRRPSLGSRRRHRRLGPLCYIRVKQTGWPSTRFRPRLAGHAPLVEPEKCRKPRQSLLRAGWRTSQRAPHFPLRPVLLP